MSLATHHTHPVLCSWCGPAGRTTIVGYSSVEGSHGICGACRAEQFASISPGPQPKIDSQPSYEALSPCADEVPASSSPARGRDFPHVTGPILAGPVCAQASTSTQGGGDAAPGGGAIPADAQPVRPADVHELSQGSGRRNSERSRVGNPACPESPSGSASQKASSRCEGGAIARDAEPLIYPSLSGSIESAEFGASVAAWSWAFALIATVVTIVALALDAWVGPLLA